MVIRKQILGALVIGLIVFAGLGLFKFLKIRSAIANQANFQPPPEAVTTFTAKTETWTDQIMSVATLTAEQGAVLSAELAGQVDSINFEPGEKVEEGRLLIALNSAAEKAQLEGAKANLQLAQSELNRAELLRKRNANSVADLDLARASLAEAHAQVINLEQQIKKKSVVAPFSGTVGIRRVNVGDYVKEGTELVPLFDDQRLYADFTLPQRYIHQVKPGLPVKIKFSEQTDSLTGRIEAADPNITTATRNFSVRAVFENPNGSLRSGMFTQIVVETDRTRSVIPIPASSISYAPYGNSIWVVKPSDSSDAGGPREVQQQFVKLGSKRGDLVAVEAGLQPGQELVSSGTFKLRPGIKVVVNNQVQPDSNINPDLPNS